MWRTAVLWQAALLLVSGNLDLRYHPQRRPHSPAPQIECYDYPAWGSDRYTRAVPAGWLHHTNSYLPSSFMKTHSFSRRFDTFLPKEDLVKEHAKLVQDINSLKQALFVAPLADRNKDYDDSIYLEAIETTTTTAPRSTTSTFRVKNPGSSIPLVLVGGASQRTVVKSQPLRFARPTASFVGTSLSPLVKHRYQLLMHSSSSPSIRICMPTASPDGLYAKPKPSLFQRILNGFISR